MPNDSASTNKVNEALRLAIQALLGDRPVAYHAVLAKALNSATAGIFLSQLLYWTPRSQQPGGWVWKTQVDIQDETALTRFEQEGARKVLRLAGVLEEKRAGVPARLFFRVDMEGLTDLLSRYQGQQPQPPTSSEPSFGTFQDAENQQSRMRKHRTQDRGNSVNLFEQKPPTITETTSETTDYTSSLGSASRDLSPSKFEEAHSQKIRNPDETEDQTEVIHEPPSESHRGFERLRSVVERLPHTRNSELGPPAAQPANRGTVAATTNPRRRPPAETDLRLAIRPYLEQYAEELGDEAPLSSTVTQAVHLYEESGLTIDGFIQQLQQAHRETQRRSGSIRKRRVGGGAGPAKNKMAYFFSVLGDYLGLKEHPTEPAIMPPSPTQQPLSRAPLPQQRARRAIGGPLVPLIRRAEPSSENDGLSAQKASFADARPPVDGRRGPRRRVGPPSENQPLLGLSGSQTEPFD